MKKGIGYLIAGGIICASAFDDIESFRSFASMFMLGLVFIAVWLLKNKFKLGSYGFFIASGIIFAAALDIDDLSSTLIALFIAAVLLYVFYYRNKEYFDMLIAGYSPGDIDEFSDEDSCTDDDSYNDPSETEVEITKVTVTKTRTKTETETDTETDTDTDTDASEDVEFEMEIIPEEE